MSEELSWASTPGRRRNMQANRSRDTQPELAVRRLIHAEGLRYRVDTQPIPALRRKGDIVFTRCRVVVFIDGCFWHGCPEHGTRTFKTNPEYWTPKIARNQARDGQTTEALVQAGWQVLRYWEHEMPSDVAANIVAVVRSA